MRPYSCIDFSLTVRINHLHTHTHNYVAVKLECCLVFTQNNKCLRSKPFSFFLNITADDYPSVGIDNHRSGLTTF